jgi:hypothetical protein
MGTQQPQNLNERVRQAAERVLDAKGYASPIKLLVQMQLLPQSSVRFWEKGGCPSLEPHFQGSPQKLAQTFSLFQAWAREKGLKPIQASLNGSARDPSHELRVTSDGDLELEAFFRTYYAAAETPQKLDAVVQKVNKPADLVVFLTVSETATCAECGAAIDRGGFLFREKTDTLCLSCADLDHLEFLASGDAALSRRARKQSPLSAVVVQFNRRAKRYERRGILVAAEAIAQAQEQCLSDADRRAVERERRATRTASNDADLVRDMAGAICGLYPGCPPAEAADIAAHTALRGSGRVGRSADGRHLQTDALRLAVAAHIRHTHTQYDELLMRGMDRQDARRKVAAKIDEVVTQWGVPGSGE